MHTGVTDSTGQVAPIVTRDARVHKSLLICGILSSVLWVAGDIAASLSYAGYSYVDYSVSELSAIGAPTRSWLAALGLVTVLLELAFAVGVWLSRVREARPAHCGGAVVCACGHERSDWPDQPGDTLCGHAHAGGDRHLRGRDGHGHAAPGLCGDDGGADPLHDRLCGRGIRPGWRWYSIATIVAALAFGAWAGTYAPAVGANLPTPGLGLIERVNVYSFYLWEALLAVMLLRAQAAAVQDASGGAGALSAH